MRNLTATLCLTLAVLLGSAGMSVSQDFQKGVDAYDTGDYSLALDEFTPLAEQGDASAQYNLGEMYRRGDGVPQDFATAMKWYTLSAEQGDAAAQYNLGQMYRRVLQDDKTAMKWYTLAAEQENANAQSNLGVMYAEVEGVLQDYVYAHMWYNIAASSGKHRNASKNRDLLAKRMNSNQIETAQKHARECVRKKYKGC